MKRRNLIIYLLFIMVIMLVPNKVIAEDYCVYTHMDKESKVPLFKAYFSIDYSSGGKLYVDNKLSYSSMTYGKGLIVESDFRLNNNKCPDMYAYYSNTLTSPMIKFFSDMSICDEQRVGDCNESRTLYMSNGVLETVGKTEKTEYCDDGKENAFKKEENKIFNQEIGDKFDNLKSKIQNYNYDIYGNYEQQKNELVSVAGVEFESYKDNYYSKFDALVSEYPCQPSTTISREKTLNNYYDSLLDETEKKLENQAKMAEQNGRADIARNIKNTISDINQDYNNLKETTSSEYDKKVTEFLNTKITNTGCESILGDVVDIVDEIFGIIKIVAPILLIVFGSLDFGQAVLQDNQDALKKATSKFIKRAIATVVIFFVPLLVRLVLRLPGMEELGLPDDPLCGLSKVVLK